MPMPKLIPPPGMAGDPMMFPPRRVSFALKTMSFALKMMNSAFK